MTNLLYSSGHHQVLKRHIKPIQPQQQLTPSKGTILEISSRNLKKTLKLLTSAIQSFDHPQKKLTIRVPSRLSNADPSLIQDKPI